MNEQVIKTILKERFESHIQRHSSIRWEDIENLLTPELLEVVSYMEETKGEPDVVMLEGQLCICDFSKESPKRRSLCYDKEARLKRKQNAPVSSVMEDAQKRNLFC